MRSVSSLHPRLCWPFSGLSVSLLGVGAGSLGQVRPGQCAIVSFLSDGPVGMSKRLVSITYFVGTRKGVLTNRPARLSGGDLEPQSSFDKRNFAKSRENPADFIDFVTIRTGACLFRRRNWWTTRTRHQSWPRSTSRDPRHIRRPRRSKLNWLRAQPR